MKVNKGAFSLLTAPYGGTMIQLKIHDESDLYNPYDPSQTRINEQVYNYLKTFFTATEYEKHFHDTLQLITDSPVDGDRFKAALLSAVQKDRDEFDNQLAVNKKRAIWACIVGLFLCAAGVALSMVTDQVLLAIISFFGTWTLSDGVAIQAKINHDLKRLKRRLDPLYDFNLEVVQTGASSPDQA